MYLPRLTAAELAGSRLRSGARPRMAGSAPQNLSPRSDAARQRDAEYPLLQRLSMLPAASTAPSSSPYRGGARFHRMRAGFAGVVWPVAVLQVFKSSPGLEPATASLPWRIRGATAVGRNRAREAVFPAFSAVQSLSITCLRPPEWPSESPHLSPQPVPNGGSATSLVTRVAERVMQGPCALNSSRGGRLRTVKLRWSRSSRSATAQTSGR
jgi:hypothetical protein